jgi:hypothetical protein
MRPSGALALILCAFASLVSPQELKHRLAVTPDEVKRAAMSRAPFLEEMKERSKRGIFPDDRLAKSLAANYAIAQVEVVNILQRDPSDVITLKTNRVLRGDVPQIFPSGDYGGPEKVRQIPSVLPEWGWERVQAREGGKFLVAVLPVRPPETPRVRGDYYTEGALDLQTDEAEWVAPIERFLTLERESGSKGAEILVRGLSDESKIVRRCSLWKLAKLCPTDSTCWNATAETLKESLRNGDEERREEAINGFETLLIRSYGVSLAIQFGAGKQKALKEMNELNPLDFSIEKDVSAPFFRNGGVLVRSRGPRKVWASPKSQGIRESLEAELADPNLAIGDEAYSLLAFLRSGALEYQGKCVFIVPALRRSFEYSGETPLFWSRSVSPLTNWFGCGE